MNESFNVPLTVRSGGMLRRWLVVAGILMAPFGWAAPGSALETTVVYREAGRFGGWPANYGSWVWGDEFLVGFASGYHQVKPVGSHQMNSDRPREPMFARSLDGGRTWQIERPMDMLPQEKAGGVATPLVEAMDFERPGFAVTFRHDKSERAFFYYSYDKGRTWRGPHVFPPLGRKGIQARTDYVVHGPGEMTVFLTALKTDGREGRPLCARTSDGGLNWTLVSLIGAEPAGFSIMPSTVVLGERGFLTVVRVKDQDDRSWIDAWKSDDRGATWTPYGRPVWDTGRKSGNPPHLLRMHDGRLCLTYGYRSEPYKMLAKLSSDNGRTWSEEIVLRTGAATHDFGYPRSFERSDGKIVTVYYFNDGPHTERFIAATTWQPPRP